ncbi:GNAT family N-acetyltransferase [Hugenholtzia roseola]|uniref:GNAT family N-acetyltransferase n=1 Tax=Hugenholtzia roseola TaxID=1002 RepID=UPI0004016152|nr:GNAT family N-acetyltransferase [Hugenholtzia roseola]
MRVFQIQTPEDLEAAFEIRRVVFVEEQGVAPSEEYDEYETEAQHYLAYSKGKAIGTARWRFTEKGIKLERFAVLRAYRTQGTGTALLKYMLTDILRRLGSGRYLYLHAQLSAMGLYDKFGFEAVGDMFEECKILHYKMELILNELPQVE